MGSGAVGELAVTWAVLASTGRRHGDRGRAGRP